MLPVRPKPQMTSSATNTMSYFLQDRLDLRRNSRAAGRSRRRHPAPARRRRPATVSGPSARIRSSSSLASRVDELGLGLAGQAVAIEVRRRDVAEAVHHRQVEAVGGIGERAGQVAGGDGDAVIGALPRDDLLLLGQAARVVVVPDQLDRGVDRLGAGIDEVGLASSAPARSRSASPRARSSGPIERWEKLWV